MSKKVFNMQGGKHSAAAYSELEKWAYGSCVASATSFVVSAGTGMNLNISTGAGIISDTIARRIGTDAVETATVPTASATYNRIDAVVAYIDTAVAPTTSVTDNTNDILKFVVVAGTAAASPVAPNDSAIQSAIGAGKPFMRLYNVTVPQNATNTSGMTFADTRYVFTDISTTKITGPAGLLGARTQYTNSGTWTKPTGLRYVIVEVIGGGGGGGGAASGSGAALAGGGGGGGGSRKKILAADLASSVSVTVGNAGSGGSAGNNGNNGNTSSFGSHVSASGGAGGAGGAATTALACNGGLGGSGSGGDLNITGKMGGSGLVLNSTRQIPGLGGDSPFGYGFGGGYPNGYANSNGDPAVGYGGGGSGGASSSGSVTGGAGSKGIVIVSEYY